MQITDEKKAILNAVQLCKKYKASLAELNRLQESQKFLLPRTNNKYLAACHIKSHPLTVLKFGYWVAALCVCFYTALPSLILLYEKISVSTDIPALLDILVESLPDYRPIALIFIAELVIYIAFFLFRRYFLRKKYLHEAEENLANLLEVNQRFQNLQQQLKSLEGFMLNLDNCIIPPKYWHVAEIIEDYVLNLRANTITDALNLYETERYRINNLLQNSIPL